MRIDAPTEVNEALEESLSSQIKQSDFKLPSVIKQPL